MRKGTYLPELPGYQKWYSGYGPLVALVLCRLPANVSNVPAAYAQEIAYSRYISEVNGDNRQNYKRMLIRISADMERLIALQFPE
ncbi:hypothetical protein [Macellibacteroides fermentans]|uniref:hypothetical protein n=1 Tax=Macellibacteroides fermentans TaxID=879969 RepID=UPI00406C7CC6